MSFWSRKTVESYYYSCSFTVSPLYSSSADIPKDNAMLLAYTVYKQDPSKYMGLGHALLEVLTGTEYNSAKKCYSFLGTYTDKLWDQDKLTMTSKSDYSHWDGWSHPFLNQLLCDRRYPIISTYARTQQTKELKRIILDTTRNMSTFDNYSPEDVIITKGNIININNSTQLNTPISLPNDKGTVTLKSIAQLPELTGRKIFGGLLYPFMTGNARTGDFNDVNFSFSQSIASCDITTKITITKVNDNLFNVTEFGTTNSSITDHNDKITAKDLDWAEEYVHSPDSTFTITDIRDSFNSFWKIRYGWDIEDTYVDMVWHNFELHYQIDANWNIVTEVSQEEVTQAVDQYIFKGWCSEAQREEFENYFRRGHVVFNKIYKVVEGSFYCAYSRNNAWLGANCWDFDLAVNKPSNNDDAWYMGLDTGVYNTQLKYIKIPVPLVDYSTDYINLDSYDLSQMTSICNQVVLSDYSEHNLPHYVFHLFGSTYHALAYEINGHKDYVQYKYDIYPSLGYTNVFIERDYYCLYVLHNGTFHCWGTADTLEGLDTMFNMPNNEITNLYNTSHNIEPVKPFKNNIGVTMAPYKLYYNLKYHGSTQEMNLEWAGSDDYTGQEFIKHLFTLKGYSATDWKNFTDSIDEAVTKTFKDQNIEKDSASLIVMLNMGVSVHEMDPNRDETISMGSKNTVAEYLFHLAEYCSSYCNEYFLGVPQEVIDDYIYSCYLPIEKKYSAQVVANILGRRNYYVQSYLPMFNEAMERKDIYISQTRCANNSALEDLYTYPFSYYLQTSFDGSQGCTNTVLGWHSIGYRIGYKTVEWGTYDQEYRYRYLGGKSFEVIHLPNGTSKFESYIVNGMFMINAFNGLYNTALSMDKNVMRDYQAFSIDVNNVSYLTGINNFGNYLTDSVDDELIGMEGSYGVKYHGDVGRENSQYSSDLLDYTATYEEQGEQSLDESIPQLNDNASSVYYRNRLNVYLPIVQDVVKKCSLTTQKDIADKMFRLFNIYNMEGSEKKKLPWYSSNAFFVFKAIYVMVMVYFQQYWALALLVLSEIAQALNCKALATVVTIIGIIYGSYNVIASGFNAINTATYALSNATTAYTTYAEAQCKKYYAKTAEYAKKLDEVKNKMNLANRNYEEDIKKLDAMFTNMELNQVQDEFFASLIRALGQNPYLWEQVSMWGQDIDEIYNRVIETYDAKINLPILNNPTEVV